MIASFYLLGTGYDDMILCFDHLNACEKPI